MERTVLFSGAEEPVAIRFAHILSKSQGDERIGTRIQLATVPPTMMRVYPQRLIYERGEFNDKVEGEAQFKWGGKKLMVDGRSKNRRLLVDHTGRTIFIKNPQTAAPRGEIDLFTGEVIPHTRGWRTRTNYKELFKNVTITDIHTFEHLTLSHVVRFFLEEEDVTAEQYSQRTGISLTVITELLRDNTTLPKQTPFDAFLEGFGWNRDDPRALVLKNSHSRAREQIRRVRREAWTNK